MATADNDDHQHHSGGETDEPHDDDDEKGQLFHVQLNVALLFGDANLLCSQRNLQPATGLETKGMECNGKGRKNVT